MPTDHPSADSPIIRTVSDGRLRYTPDQRQALREAFDRGGMSALSFTRQHGIQQCVTRCVVLALTILKGIQKEGTEYLGMMAPLGAALDDEKLAAVMTYLRGSFGSNAPAVCAEDAAKYREQWKAIEAPVSRAKIAELSAAKP